MKRILIILTMLLVVNVHNLVVNANEVVSSVQQEQTFVLPSGEISKDVYFNDFFIRELYKLEIMYIRLL